MQVQKSLLHSFPLLNTHIFTIIHHLYVQMMIKFAISSQRITNQRTIYWTKSSIQPRIKPWSMKQLTISLYLVWLLALKLQFLSNNIPITLLESVIIIGLFLMFLCLHNLYCFRFNSLQIVIHNTYSLIIKRNKYNFWSRQYQNYLMNNKGKLCCKFIIQIYLTSYVLKK